MGGPPNRIPVVQLNVPPPAYDPASFSHTIVVVLVVVAASVLATLGHLNDATLGTVYGGALGYASGLSVGSSRRN